MLLSKHLLLATTAKPCIASSYYMLMRRHIANSHGDGEKRGLWCLINLWERECNRKTRRHEQDQIAFPCPKSTFERLLMFSSFPLLFFSPSLSHAPTGTPLVLLACSSFLITLSLPLPRLNAAVVHPILLLAAFPLLVLLHLTTTITSRLLFLLFLFAAFLRRQFPPASSSSSSISCASFSYSASFSSCS